MILSATFASIGIEHPAAPGATAVLDFKPASDTIWHAALPPHNTGDAFYGSALLCQPGTLYDVRLTIAGTVVQGQVTTRVEDPVAPSPTHYLSPLGADTNNGQSAPWKTLDKALRVAPSGAVVLVEPGYYTASLFTRTLPITLLAHYPAVVDDCQPINLGQHAVVDSGVVSAPNSGKWLPVTPDGNPAHPIWKWPAAWLTTISALPTQLGVAASRDALPARIANWKHDSVDLSTPAGWANLLYTNRSYHYGWYAFGKDIYLRLPGDLDPNTMYVTVGGGGLNGINANGPHIRVSGFEIRTLDGGVVLGAASSSGQADHCLISGCAHGVLFNAGQPGTYGHDHLVEKNLIIDANLFRLDGGGIPWTFIKANLTRGDGSTYPGNRFGEQSESSAVWGRGGAQRVTVRHNTFDGTFNGVSGYNASYDRYSESNYDIHDNLIVRCVDDALEPEGNVINYRAWNNRVEDCGTFMSLGPVNYGPVYAWNNTAFRIGNRGASLDGLGQPGISGVFFKYSGACNPRPRVYVVGNSFWTDTVAGLSVSGGDNYAGSGSTPPLFWLRNNVLRTNRYVFSVAALSWDEDYNAFTTTDTARGIEIPAGKKYTAMSAYRTGTGQGAHSNQFGGQLWSIIDPARLDASLIDPTHGNLGLAANSPLLACGIPVVNIYPPASTPDIGVCTSEDDDPVIAQLQQQIHDLQAQIDVLQAQLDSEIQDMQAELAAKQAEVDTATAALAAAQAHHAAYVVSVQALLNQALAVAA